MKFVEAFKRPPCEFRGKPFWAWNGKLEKDEACRQIDVFKEMGLGGAFMHSRVGLDTAYLSKEWFDVVSACVEKARKNGMEMWLYDEDRWPSGAAGGLVTKDPKYRLRHLRMDVLKNVSSFKPLGGELAFFAAELDGASMKSLRRLASVKEVSSLENEESLLVFKEEVASCSSWYNGFTYLDTMSEEAVGKFIEVTHEQYLKHNGKDFGKTIPGIFTDEPNYGGCEFSDGLGRTQWTGRLPKVFKERYGYDIMDRLPEIFFKLDGAETSKLRRDYYDCMSFLFANAFGKLIYEFCEKAGMQYTGHVLAEETLSSQTSVIGAAMRFYEYMQAPGIDILCAQGLSRKGGREMEILTAKQCESMRRQFGRKWMLSELYGCTGWDFTFAEHKAVGDWQAAMGVNLRCQHLSWYTMKGDAKRDYPASISFQSAWWKDYPTVEDYFSRVNVALTQGEPVRDLAVLHPIESAWSLFRPIGWQERKAGGNISLQCLDKSLVKMQDILLESHHDFDYIDEDVIARHASVEGSELKVGLVKYKAIVVPPVLLARRSTVKLLESFVKAGGTLVMAQAPKELVNLEFADSLAPLKAIAKLCPLEKNAVVKALSKAELRNVSIKAKTGRQYPDCLYMLRRDEKTGLTILFITHSRQDKDSGSLEVKVPAVGKAFEFDAASGEILAIESASVKGGQTVFKTSLPPYGSRLFVIEDNGKEAIKATSSRMSFKKAKRKPLSLKGCEFSLTEPNAFPLDMADYNVGKGLVGPLEVLMLDRALKDIFGLPYRGGQMVQPWAREPRKDFVKRPAEIVYRFKAEFVPSSPVWMVMESPSEFKCKLNGSEVQLKDEGWWIDNSFRKIRLPKGSVKEGWNEIVLSTDYGPDSGIEAIYILGDFGFKWDAGGRPVMTAMPERIGLGDWSKYNLSTYTGGLGYIAEIETKLAKGERLFVELPAWDGVMAKILVDGKAVGDVAWPPCELDITDAVAGKSKCKLEIRIVAGRRNLLGPLHLSNKRPVWVGPGQFVCAGQDWAQEHVVMPVGLTKASLLAVKS